LIFLLRLALHRVGIAGSGDFYKQDFQSRFNEPQERMNTLRTLSEATQVGTSAYDGIRNKIFGCYSLESVEMLLLHQSVWTGISKQEDAWVMQYAFMKVLNCYRTGSSEWEYLIRRLLRKGVDIYDCVGPRCTVGDRYSCCCNDRHGDSTPLDELFANVETPSDAKDVADHWLDILHQEGYDIERYLKTEFELHVSDQQLTNLDPQGEASRQLLFCFESKLSVSFDWVAGLDCVAFLVWREFLQMNQLSHWGLSGFDSVDKDYWRFEWPFSYSAWSSERKPFPAEHEDYPEWLRSSKLFRVRSERRVKAKALKRARAQGHAVERRMPGSWPR